MEQIKLSILEIRQSYDKLNKLLTRMNNCINYKESVKETHRIKNIKEQGSIR